MNSLLSILHYLITLLKKNWVKDLWHFDRVSAYFSDASQTFQTHKISLVSFWMWRLLYKERIKDIIRQAGPYNTSEDATIGGRGCKIWLHQNSKKSIIFTCKGTIINTQLQITVKVFLSPKSWAFWWLFFCCFSDLLRNILKCNRSPYSTLMTMHLPVAIWCNNVL